MPIMRQKIVKYKHKVKLRQGAVKKVPVFNLWLLSTENLKKEFCRLDHQATSPYNDMWKQDEAYSRGMVVRDILEMRGEALTPIRRKCKKNEHVSD